MYPKPAITADKNHSGVLLRIGLSASGRLAQLDTAERLIQCFQSRRHGLVVAVNQEARSDQSSRYDDRHPAAALAMVEVIVKHLEEYIYSQDRQAKRGAEREQRAPAPPD